MSLSENEQRESLAAPRRWVLLILAWVAFAGVIGRLYGLQIRQGEVFRVKSLNNFVHFERLEHERGEIVDREGRLLVTNRPSLNVYITPAYLPPALRHVRQLGRVLGLTRSECDQRARSLSDAVREKGPPFLLAGGLTQEQVSLLREEQEHLELPLDAIWVIDEGKEGPYSAYLDPQNFPSTGRVLDRLASLLELDAEEARNLERQVRSTRGLAKYRDITVRRDIPPDMEGPLSVQIQTGDLPGVTVRRASARHYVYGDLAAHTLGYVNELTQDQLERRREQGYRLGDTIGRRGVERSYESTLRGTDGKKTVVVDSKGRSQGSKLAEDLQEDVGVFALPRPGHRAVLTLDLDLQKVAEEVFTGKAGAIVVMETDTGRLLVVTSTPSYNPNKLAGYVDPTENKRLDRMGELGPWRFRATQDFFAPGSTFKVVTALAALQYGFTTPDEHVFCPGYYVLGKTKFRCWKDHGHGWVNLEHSMAKSCDVYYYTMGARMGLDRIAEMGRALGFGRPTEIPIPPESKGIMPTSNWYRRRREGYTLGAAVNASIGQGAVTVTPMQLTVAFAAIANGGTIYQPQIVQRIETYDGKLVEKVAPKVLRQLELDPEALEHVREGLREVVNEPFGTAYSRRLRDMQVSGKTGTAQVAKLGKRRRRTRDLPWKLRDHAWFAAFAPAEDPKIAVVVLVEHGGGGSSVAAPIAMKVIDAWQKLREAKLGQSFMEPIHVRGTEDSDSPHAHEPFEEHDGDPAHDEHRAAQPAKDAKEKA